MRSHAQRDAWATWTSTPHGVLPYVATRAYCTHASSHTSPDPPRARPRDHPGVRQDGSQGTHEQRTTLTLPRARACSLRVTLARTGLSWVGGEGV